LQDLSSPRLFSLEPIRDFPPFSFSLMRGLPLRIPGSGKKVAHFSTQYPFPYVFQGPFSSWWDLTKTPYGRSLSLDFSSRVSLLDNLSFSICFLSSSEMSSCCPFPLLLNVADSKHFTLIIWVPASFFSVGPCYVISLYTRTLFLFLRFPLSDILVMRPRLISLPFFPARPRPPPENSLSFSFSSPSRDVSLLDPSPSAPPLIVYDRTTPLLRAARIMG